MHELPEKIQSFKLPGYAEHNVFQQCQAFHSLTSS